MVWDTGPFQNLTEKKGVAIPLAEAVAHGHVKVWLEGRKLKGGYALTRFKTGKDEAWLLVKADDEAADPAADLLKTRPESALRTRGGRHDIARTRCRRVLPAAGGCMAEPGRARPRPRRAGGRNARAAALAICRRCSAPSRSCHRVSDLVRYAADASPYRLLPRVVVLARDVDDVRRVLGYARANGHRVTLRAAGTSLNGQAQGDGILIDVRRHWRGVRIVDDGRARARQAGNRRRPRQPPARRATARTARARSGERRRMHGRRRDRQQLRRDALRHDRRRLLDGAIDDAAARLRRRSSTPRRRTPRHASRRPSPSWPPACSRSATSCAPTRAGARVCGQKFEIKNTTGYRPVRVPRRRQPARDLPPAGHRLGGTLALIAEAVLDTVAVADAQRGRVAALRRHRRRRRAGERPRGARSERGRTGRRRAAARRRRHDRRRAGDWRELPVDSAALLARAVGRRRRGARRRRSARPTTCSATTSCCGRSRSAREREAIAAAWRVRNGKFGLFGRVRPPGSSMILEDICVPPAALRRRAFMASRR